MRSDVDVTAHRFCSAASELRLRSVCEAFAMHLRSVYGAMAQRFRGDFVTNK
jgi:hypothetical protein